MSGRMWAVRVKQSPAHLPADSLALKSLGCDFVVQLIWNCIPVSVWICCLGFPTVWRYFHNRCASRPTICCHQTETGSTSERVSERTPPTGKLIRQRLTKQIWSVSPRNILCYAIERLLSRRTMQFLTWLWLRCFLFFLWSHISANDMINCTVLFIFCDVLSAATAYVPNFGINKKLLLYSILFSDSIMEKQLRQNVEYGGSDELTSENTSTGSKMFSSFFCCKCSTVTCC